jgi:hypothetical protein
VWEWIFATVDEATDGYQDPLAGVTGRYRQVAGAGGQRASSVRARDRRPPVEIVS